MTSDGREGLLNGLLEIKQPRESEGLRVNLDTILLAHFTQPRKNEKIIELGCAHGAVSLILAKRGFEVEGIDIQNHLIKLARENAIFNSLEKRTTFHTMDLRNHRKKWQAQTFDRVVVNPPYDEIGRTNPSPSDARAAAVHGLECKLSDVAEAARYLLKNKGRLDMVIRAGRLGELFTCLSANNITPKIIQAVHPKPSSDASVVLVEAMRAAGQGLTVRPPLFVRDERGRETPELLNAYKIDTSEAEK